MNNSGPSPASTGDLSHCLARSVIEALAEDPTLEAVTIDRTRKRIMVATLGKADVPRLAERIDASFRRAQESSSRRCSLLAGHGRCQSCAFPLSDAERQRISIEHAEAKTTIARVTCPTAPKLWRWRDLPWPRVVQRDVDLCDRPEAEEEWKAQLAAAVLCGVCGIAGYALREQPISVAAYLVAFVAGGWFAAGEVWEKLRHRAIDVHFLMLAVAVGSASIGAWGEGAMLLFLFSLSGALEHFAFGRTQREIRSLFHGTPKSATVLDAAGQERQVKIEQLTPGMRLLVKPGEQFPVDAEVVKGETACDESPLTGEATPVEKRRGDVVLSGTMNLWGVVELTALRSVSESALQRIITLIKEAQRQKAPSQKFTDRFGTTYTYTVLGLSVAMFFVWWLGFGQQPFRAEKLGHSAFYHTMTLLVVASPCALVLSIPSAVLAAIAWAARHGILFRGGAAVEKLAEITTVALDKTGTLTTGELTVESIESYPAGREAEILELAFSIEKLSTHPLARTITRHGNLKGLKPVELSGFESITGMGLRARKGAEECLVGRREWLVKGSHRELIGNLPAPDAGTSEIWVACGGLLGRILLRDTIRPQSRPVLLALRKKRLKTVVLTGDRLATAQQLAATLPMDEIRAELKPEDKVAEIRKRTTAGERVAMVGDGVNDAASLAAAHIGVAMGARGADAALEQADIVLMHDRLENFLAALRLSRRARRIIRQNLVISLATVLVLAGFALMGRIPLTLGVVGHEGSTVIVVMNSLRLLFGKSVLPREHRAEA